jgi:predicted RNase H-like HicB family nuclease
VELTVVVRKEGPSYWAEIEQLPGCFASGGTLDELGDALKEAVRLYLDDETAELSHGQLRVGELVVSVLTRSANA